MSKHVDGRSAVAMLAAVGTIICANLAVMELDRQDAAIVAAMEAAKQSEVQAVTVTQEEIWPVYNLETEEVAQVETVTLYEVPLDDDLQLFIIQLCEDHHIEPSLVLAMIQRESNFKANAIGDDGNAFGLMQIWYKWHWDRMDRLGVTDLLDPYGNVTVGVDYLAELIDKGKGLEWAIAAFNQGPDGANDGFGFTYVEEVLAIQKNIVERTDADAVHG